MGAAPNPLVPGHQGQKPTINVMVVDPSMESRSLLKGALRSIHIVDTIRESSTAQNVLEMVRESPVDVVFLEQDLGEDVNVFDLVRQIKSDPAGAKVSFVLASAKLDMESRQQGMSAGILGYLGKPFDIRGLEASLRDARAKVSTNHKDTLDKVRRIGFFSEFADLELVRLLKICHTRKFSAGETIFSEGEIGDRFFIVLAGKVELLKQRKDRVESLATVSPGDCFGEMAIVDMEPRSADARAVSDASLIEVNAQIIKNVNDVLALKIFRKLAILVTRKLRNYTSQAEPSD